MVGSGLFSLFGEIQMRREGDLKFISKIRCERCEGFYFMVPESQTRKSYIMYFLLALHVKTIFTGIYTWLLGWWVTHLFQNSAHNLSLTIFFH